MTTSSWGSDVPVSMPQPIKPEEGLIPMYGFVFTQWGLFHDLSEADHEQFSLPPAGPVSPNRTVRDDQGIGDGSG